MSLVYNQSVGHLFIFNFFFCFNPIFNTTTTTTDLNSLLQNQLYNFGMVSIYSNKETKAVSDLFSLIPFIFYFPMKFYTLYLFDS